MKERQKRKEIKMKKGNQNLQEGESGRNREQRIVRKEKRRKKKQSSAVLEGRSERQKERIWRKERQKR